MPATLEAALVVTIFILPGFISLFTLSLFYPVRMKDSASLILKCFALSAFVHLFVGWYTVELKLDRQQSSNPSSKVEVSDTHSW